MGYTMTEKILSRASDQQTVHAGENHAVHPARMIAYDFPGYTDVMFRQMREDFGITELTDPSRYIVFIDHMLTKRNDKEAEVHQVTRDWCEFYGIELHEVKGPGDQLRPEQRSWLELFTTAGVPAHVARVRWAGGSPRS